MCVKNLLSFSVVPYNKKIWKKQISAAGRILLDTISGNLLLKIRGLVCIQKDSDGREMTV